MVRLSIVELAFLYCFYILCGFLACLEINIVINMARCLFDRITIMWLHLYNSYHANNTSLLVLLRNEFYLLVTCACSIFIRTTNPCKNLNIASLTISILKPSFTGSEDKSLALPRTVVESLSWKSCDPKEIVLQLKQSLQLDQTSLEQPDPKTKRLIRYLARRAQRLNRLDVVKHLKEITPAGTAGKHVICFITIHFGPATQLSRLWKHVTSPYSCIHLFCLPGAVLSSIDDFWFWECYNFILYFFLTTFFLVGPLVPGDLWYWKYPCSPDERHYSSLERYVFLLSLEEDVDLLHVICGRTSSYKHHY